MKKVYVISYDGCISRECYTTEEKAFKHLEEQGYKQVMGYLFKNNKSSAYIKDLQVK